MPETLDRNVEGFMFIIIFEPMPSSFKIGKLKFTVPNSWDECSTKLFFQLAVADHSDYIGMISILSGLDRKVFAQSKLLNLDVILQPHLEWLNEKIDWENIETPTEVIFGLKKIKIPYDLDLESFGQKIVMDSIIDECTKIENEETIVNYSKLIPYAFAVYIAHKYYGKDFDRDLVDKMLPTVMELPIMTVYPIGAFFLRTHFGFASSTWIDSLMIETTMRWLRKLKRWINSAISKRSTPWREETF